MCTVGPLVSDSGCKWKVDVKQNDIQLLRVVTGYSNAFLILKYFCKLRPNLERKVLKAS